MESFYPHLHGNYSTRNFNRRAVLELIRYTPGGISRAELARKIDLTRSTVSTIVTDLLVDGLVRETESGPATGGGGRSCWRLIRAAVISSVWIWG